MGDSRCLVNQYVANGVSDPIDNIIKTQKPEGYLQVGLNTKPVYVLGKVPLSHVKKMIDSVGTRIGAVEFIKRTDGSLRKMCYRLHVNTPSQSSGPKAKIYPKKDESGFIRNSQGRFTKALVRDIHGRFVKDTQKISKQINERNNQVTVFDVNKVEFKDGQKIRGAYRTIPLDGIKKVTTHYAVFILS